MKKNNDTIERPIAQSIEEIVGAIGGDPGYMIALTALEVFPEDSGGTVSELNDRIRKLRGSPPDQSKNGGSFLHTHDYRRIFGRAGLIEKVDTQRNTSRRQPFCARLSAKGQLAVAVSGVLLPAELNAPQDRFLEKVYGYQPYINRPSPRPSIYNRLLAGPASSKELKAISNTSRSTFHNLLKELIDTGVCKREDAEDARDKNKELYGRIALTPLFHQNIAIMTQRLTSLEREDKDGGNLRQRAAEKARTIIDWPHLVNKLLYNSPSARRRANIVPYEQP